jgi:hypothetical protein
MKYTPACEANGDESLCLIHRFWEGLPDSPGVQGLGYFGNVTTCRVRLAAWVLWSAGMMARFAQFSRCVPRAAFYYSVSVRT